MASYDFKCGSCTDVKERSFPIGEAPRIHACEFCGGIAQLVIGAQVQIAPSALETKGAAVRHTNLADKRLDSDRTAYKRMRDRGLQPKTVGGSSRLENEVGDNVDIEWQEKIQPLAPKEPWKVTKERVQEGIQLSNESTVSPAELGEWRKK